MKNRLDNGERYPKTIWINFGRTVKEGSMKLFSDLVEQILDDNIGNDFVGLPYINLIVITNTAPNLNQLIDNRLNIIFSKK